MTDTKPTLEELIDYQQRLCENNPPNPVVYILTKEILASLKELASCKHNSSVTMDELGEMRDRAEKAEAKLYKVENDRLCSLCGELLREVGK